MRKQSANFLTFLLLALLLTGCGKEPTPQTTAPLETTLPAVTAVPAETTVPPETEALTEPAATSGGVLPYLLRIDRADQSIFEGPGYDYVFVGTVQQAGTYTIVEESWDQEGNLWGKLKSGVGWVDLSQMQSAEYKNALISANYADDYMLLHGAYHYCPSDEEYRVPVAFRAYGKLRDVTLFVVEYDAEGPCPGADFFSLPEMTAEMPLVAELAFPGDMSMYGIRFVDEAGSTHVYHIYISLRNGALMLVAA